MLSNNRYILALLLLAVITLLAYANVSVNGFVYDDESVLSGNPRVEEWRFFKYLFHPYYFKVVDKGKETAFGEASYRPVVTATYFFDAALWHKAAVGTHLFNLLLHLLNVILLYNITRKFMNSEIGSLFSSLLYAVHPVLTEAVNAVGFREDLLTVLFILLSLFCFHARWAINSSWKRYAVDLLHCACYGLALFSKEMAATYPILLALVMYVRKNSFRRSFTLFLMLFVMTLFYLLIRFAVMVNPNPVTLIYPGGSFISNIYTMATIIAGYFRLILYPLHLLLDYQPEPQTSIVSITVLFSLLIIVLMGGTGLYMLVKYRSFWGMGIIWFFIALAPVVNVMKIGNIAAERYLYLPCIGIAWCFGVLVRCLFKRHKRLTLIVMLVLVSLWSVRTMRRNIDWLDTPSIWAATIAIEPESYRAHSNLAGYYFDQGDYKAALKHYIRCITLERTPQNYYNLGNTYRKVGDLKRAIDAYNTALDIDPTYAEIHNNLGLTYMDVGDYNRAEKELLTALRYGTSNASAYENLGLVYATRGEYDRAITYYRKVMQMKPDKPSVYNKMAVAFIEKGELSEGVRILHQAYQRFPMHPHILRNMAVLYNMLGNEEKEIYYWLRVIDIEPNAPDAVSKLADYYIRTGQLKKAHLYSEKLKRLQTAP